MKNTQTANRRPDGWRLIPARTSPSYDNVAFLW